MNGGGVADVLGARGHALRKAGYQVLTAMTQSEVLRLSMEAKPSLILIGRVHGLRPDICLRIKSQAATAEIPIIALCSSRAASEGLSSSVR